MGWPTTKRLAVFRQGNEYLSDENPIGDTTRFRLKKCPATDSKAQRERRQQQRDSRVAVLKGTSDSAAKNAAAAEKLSDAVSHLPRVLKEMLLEAFAEKREKRKGNPKRVQKMTRANLLLERNEVRQCKVAWPNRWAIVQHCIAKLKTKAEKEKTKKRKATKVTVKPNKRTAKANAHCTVEELRVFLLDTLVRDFGFVSGRLIESRVTAHPVCSQSRKGDRIVERPLLLASSTESISGALFSPLQIPASLL